MPSIFLVLKGIHDKYHYILLLQISRNQMSFVGVVHPIVIKFSFQTLIFIYGISTYRMKVSVPFCPVKVISCFLQVSFVYEFPIHYIRGRCNVHDIIFSHVIAFSAHVTLVGQT